MVIMSDESDWLNKKVSGRLIIASLVPAEQCGATSFARACAGILLRACLKTHQKRRVRARGLQEIARFGHSCRPGALTGRVFKQALRLGFAFAFPRREIKGYFARFVHDQIRSERLSGF